MLGMPRRVSTYPAGLGWDTLNLVSSAGACFVAAGLALLTFELVRPKGHRPYAKRNPWNAGTLEWLTEMPGKPWGSRSIPTVDSRYPLWDQPDLIRRVDAGEFYLADAAEGKRETLITSVVEAQPLQCMRVVGPSFLPMTAAAFTGAAFVVATFHLYWTAAVCGALAVLTILFWLWQDTALVPERIDKDVGLGLTLPIYGAGPRSCGWWAMFITMTADVTAFLTLVFAFFYLVTINDDFALRQFGAVGMTWPSLGLAGAVGTTAIAWGLRRRGFARGSGSLWLVLATVAACGGAAAMIAGPIGAGIAPTSHALAAMTWTLLGWTTVHLALGALMLLFCLVALLTGRLDRDHNAHLWNTELYWHFATFTALVSALIIAGMPLQGPSA